MGSTRTQQGSSARWLLAVACGLAAVPAAAAPSLQMQVTAQVREHARMRVLSQPAFFDVGSGDIARGYVDVDTPVTVEVIGNMRRGVQLTFTALDTHVRRAHTLSAVHTGQGGSGWRSERMEVRLRLDLAEDARAGRHAWPVQISMAPL